jgi:flavin-dependent dehydrogenase
MRYDVVVVGGRLAGASTAMLLARAGARVALVERTAFGSDTVSTHALMRAGVLQLSRWGLLDDVVDAGTPAIRSTLFHYAGDRTVRVSIRPSPGVDALYAPRRHVLDRILVEAATEAGVEVHDRHTATAVLPDHREPRRAGGVRVKSPDGTIRDLRARITVGADGISSTVAAGVGARVVRRGRAASAVLYRYLAGVPAAGYEWAYGDGAGAGLIPTNEGLTCVFVATTPRRMRALRREGVDEAFSTLLADAAPGMVDRLEHSWMVGRTHGWAGAPGFVRRAYGPGWALVGDAGYFKDPITTHGMTDALRDAELLGTAIAGTLAGAVSEPLAMRRYQRTRDELSHQLFAATEAVARYDWDLPTVEARLRQVSSAMSDEVDHLQGLPDPTGERSLRGISPDGVEAPR